MLLTLTVVDIHVQFSFVSCLGFFSLINGFVINFPLYIS